MSNSKQKTVSVYIFPGVTITHQFIPADHNDIVKTNKFKLSKQAGGQLVELPNGTVVTVGKNKYVLVDEFIDYDLKKLPKPSVYDISITLLAHTPVIMENGFTVLLEKDLVGTVDADCDITIPYGSKLQQLDEPIQLVLENGVQAKIVPTHSNKRAPKKYIFGGIDEKDHLEAPRIIYSESPGTIYN